MTSYEKMTALAMWFSAIGTCGTVAYALFGAVVRRWFNKPKLRFSISEKFPHCLLKKQDNPTSSNTNIDIVEICASVTNQKKWCATNSRIMCTGLFIPDAGGAMFCQSIKMRPLLFQWVDSPESKGAREIDIAQSVSCFVKIAEISCPQNEMSANDPKNINGDGGAASLAISIGNPITREPHIRIPFEHKSALISVRVLYSGNKPEDYFIRIDWRGSKVEDYNAADKLKVSLLPEKEGLALVNK